jgi:hypothetical protein
VQVFFEIHRGSQTLDWMEIKEINDDNLRYLKLLGLNFRVWNPFKILIGIPNIIQFIKKKVILQESS